MKACRICFEEDSEKNLIRPCRCKGSMHEVHPSCMEHWIKIKGIRECEICHARLNIRSRYPSIPHVVYKLSKALWRDKKKLVKIILLAIYGQFLFKRLMSLRGDFALLTKSTNRSWIKMFGLGALFGVYYAQLVFVFLREAISMLMDLIRIVKGTAHITIDNYYL